MTRPGAIGRFEQFWWGSTILWLLGSVLTYGQVRSTLLANPQTAALAGAAQPAIIVVVLLVSVALWYAVARRGSAVARWLVIAVAVGSGLIALSRLLGLVTGTAAPGLSVLVLLIANVLSVAAAVALFRRDTAAWFGVGEADAPERFG